MQLPEAICELALWDRLDLAAAEQMAKDVEQQLPAPWRLARVETLDVAGQRRSVAFFDWNQCEFALVPGGTVLLGYDPAEPPDLTPQDREDWKRARSEYGDLDEHLRATMTLPRRIVLRPFLMEVLSCEMDTEPIRSEGQIVGRRSINISVGQVREWAGANGFSLPNSDQWEHACRGGSRTFWWWGNTLRFPMPEYNGFGLRIAWDTYRSEWCTEPDVYRGGDGGCAGHGGLDGLPVALRLAAAYFEPFAEAADDAAAFMGDCRRVFSLGDR